MLHWKTVELQWNSTGIPLTFSVGQLTCNIKVNKTCTSKLKIIIVVVFMFFEDLFGSNDFYIKIKDPIKPHRHK